MHTILRKLIRIVFLNIGFQKIFKFLEKYYTISTSYFAMNTKDWFLNSHFSEKISFRGYLGINNKFNNRE